MADRVFVGNVRGPQGNPGTPGAPGSPGAPGKDAVVDDALDENSTNAVQNAVVTKELNKVFQSVSEGKSMIASAITDKGVETDATATFETMAGNIGQIESGGDWSMDSYTCQKSYNSKVKDKYKVERS